MVMLSMLVVSHLGRRRCRPGSSGGCIVNAGNGSHVIDADDRSSRWWLPSLSLSYVFIPWYTQIEALRPRNRKIVLGRVECTRKDEGSSSALQALQQL